jgi:hypothetical protein
VKVYALLAAGFTLGCTVALVVAMYVVGGAGTSDPFGSVADLYAASLLLLVPFLLAGLGLRAVTLSVRDVIDWRRSRAVAV